MLKKWLNIINTDIMEYVILIIGASVIIVCKIMDLVLFFQKRKLKKLNDKKELLLSQPIYHMVVYQSKHKKEMQKLTNITHNLLSKKQKYQDN